MSSALGLGRGLYRGEVHNKLEDLVGVHSVTSPAPNHVLFAYFSTPRNGYSVTTVGSGGGCWVQESAAMATAKGDHPGQYSIVVPAFSTAASSSEENRPQSRSELPANSITEGVEAEGAGAVGYGSLLPSNVAKMMGKVSLGYDTKLMLVSFHCSICLYVSVSPFSPVTKDTPSKSRGHGLVISRYLEGAFLRVKTQCSLYA